MPSSELTLKSTEPNRLTLCLSDIEDCKVEFGFTLRETVIRARHAFGAIILEHFPTQGERGRHMKTFAKQAGTSLRNIQYAVAFAGMFPNVDDYIDTQNKTLSWTKVITEHLTLPPAEPDGGPGLEGTTLLKDKNAHPKTDLTKLYIKYTKGSQCLFCTNQSEPSHFPRTQKRGTPEWAQLPMCRGCHTRLHQDPKKFWETTMWTYRNQVFGHFYEFIGNVEVK